MRDATCQIPIFNQGVCPHLLHHMHPHHRKAVLKGDRYIARILVVGQYHGKHETCNMFPRCQLKSADWSRGRFARRKRNRFVLSATLATLADDPTKTDLCTCHLVFVLSVVPMYRVVFLTGPPLVLSTKKLIKARLGVSRTIYVNLDSPNLGFTNFNF